MIKLNHNDINNIFCFVQNIDNKNIAYEHSSIVFELFAMEKNFFSDNVLFEEIEIPENAYFDVNTRYSNFKTLFNFIFSMKNNKNILPYNIGE